MSESTEKHKKQEELTEEEKQALLEQYDTEANTRSLTGIAATVVFFILIAFSLFQLYTGAFGQYTAYIQRTVHLGFALVLIFFLFLASKKGGKKNKVLWYDIIMLLRRNIVFTYSTLFFETFLKK